MSELNIKKRILISFLTVFTAFTLLLGAVVILAKYSDKIMYDEIPRGNAIFPYDANYTENIFTDKEYMELDRLVCYTDVRTGVTLSIDDNNYASYNDVVVFMYEYIRSIIYGDNSFYNNCYSDRFLAVEGEQHPFTMQKLYDIEFGVMSVDEVTSNGVLSKVWLDYKIFKNNVTLRTDIGSDVNRRQYLTLIKEGENYKIISVSYVNVQPRKQLNLTRTILMIAGLIVVLGATGVGTVWVLKKMIVKPKTSTDQSSNADKKCFETEKTQHKKREEEKFEE
ncbi:MAG: hypothetical protein E7601_06455 [Ruminococcaceae bacterium]|nr:hypothetical protein [Oscillospiraceae bacterium]